jgi:hypothetical protein
VHLPPTFARDRIAVGTAIAISRPAGNVAVIGEERPPQVPWDDAFTSGSSLSRSSFPVGRELKLKQRRRNSDENNHELPER